MFLCFLGVNLISENCANADMYKINVSVGAKNCATLGMALKETQ